jgi:hypothetical protein
MDLNDIINPTPGVFAIANTAAVSNALFSNTFSSRNAAVGAKALSINTTGNGNIAYGESSLFFNTTGSVNTALGSSALVFNTVSNFNTAVAAIRRTGFIAQEFEKAALATVYDFSGKRCTGTATNDSSVENSKWGIE